MSMAMKHFCVSHVSSHMTNVPNAYLTQSKFDPSDLYGLIN